MRAEASGERWVGGAGECVPSASARVRLEGVVRAHYDEVWRLLRRLGLAKAEADDAMQEVLLVASRRIEDIAAGREFPFLFGTALRVAANVRRRRRCTPTLAPVESLADSRPPADELTDLKRLRELFDAALDEMDEELRIVIVLFEVEGFTAPQIAEIVCAPTGTIASRLRRGRQQLLASWRRLQSNTLSEAGGGR